jgi:hypothetical protein
MAERRPLRALAYAADLRISCRRQLINNLLAGVPNGRPFNSGSTAFFGNFIPSGLVPGDGVAGRDWRRRRELGGNGLDCFPYICFRVLVVIGEDWSVILDFLEVLIVSCKTTAHD